MATLPAESLAKVGGAMGNPPGDAHEERMEIDVARVVALALEQNPATAKDAKAAVQRAVEKLYPDLEDAAAVFDAVWTLAQMLARQRRTDVVSQLRELASSQSMLRLTRREVTVHKVYTGSSGGPSPLDEKLLSALHAGRFVGGRPGAGRRIWAAAWFVGGVLVGAALLALVVWMVFLR